MKGFRSEFSKSGLVRQNGIKAGIQTGYATSLFTGDPVNVSGGYLVRSTPTSQDIAGIFLGVEYVDAAGVAHVSPYWPASTSATNIVAYYEPVDSDVVFEVEADDTMAQTTLGQYATYIIGTGNTRTGQSAAVLDASSANASSTGLDVRIVGILNYTREDGVYNEWGATNTRVLVTPLRVGNDFVA